MTGAPRLCLLGSHEARLRSFLESHPQGHERAAAILFRRHSHRIEGLADSDRYVAVEVVPFDDAWVTFSSSVSVDFEVAPMRELFQRCEEEGLVFGFAHNHPGGALQFSWKDEQNELTLLKALTNRNGVELTFVAMLLCDGKWIGRVRHGQRPEVPVPARHIAVVDAGRLHLHGIRTAQDHEDDHVLARQAAAFGRPFVNKMRSIRIGVVGASGTGSPSGTLLVRSGAGELVFVDKDKLAQSNLNRVRGARLRDVGVNKAQWIRDYVLELNLGSAVAAFDTNLDEDPDAVDALATCDVILGCTDDQIGREVINAACFYFGVPLIDMGLGGWVDKDPAGEIRLRGHYGRVSTVCPEAGECLLCQGVVTPEGVRRQYALREDPHLSEEELRERYLAGGGEMTPGVGPFTSAVADYAVATLYDVLTGFRRWPDTLRKDMLLVDFVLMEMRSPERTGRIDCPFCGTREHLLKRTKHRLGRPALGASHVAY